MLHFRISDSSEVTRARCLVTELAQHRGWSATDVDTVAGVIAEIGANILKYAGRGELLIQETSEHHTPGLDLLALDTGPGIEQEYEYLRKGNTTADSLGNGLDTIKQIAARVEIFSLPAIRTALFVRILAQRTPQTQLNGARNVLMTTLPAGEFTTGVVSVTKTGEIVCGDGWAVSQKPNLYRLMVADGSGHGPEANEAIQLAVRVFHQRIAATLTNLMGAMHSALRATRGAAIAVAEINRTEHVLRYCGVGNICATLLIKSSVYSLDSLHGVVGHQLPKLQEFSYPWHSQSLLVMHSVGLASRWSVDRYPGLLACHPLVIAGVLYRDFNRGGRDDVTVVVARQEKQGN
jgi:anti-sigma regulatory factor (Ser/Thr protein kinase)